MNYTVNAGLEKELNSLHTLDEMREALRACRKRLMAEPGNEELVSRVNAALAGGINVQRQRRTAVNAALHEIGMTYHEGLPVEALGEILETNGYDTQALAAMSVGNGGGGLHEQVGANDWLTVRWYKMPVSGRFEVVAYIN
jgi:DNA-binding PucR family transcriptional regulator